MPFTDLDSIHIPSAGTRPPATWGLGVNANFDEVYNAVLSKLVAHTSFTPTITQSNAPSKTVNHARYFKLGRFAFIEVDVTFTSNGTGAQPIIMSYPVGLTPVRQANGPCGEGSHYNASTSIPLLCLKAASGIGFQDASVGGGFYSPAAVANTHVLQLNIAYECTT